MNRDRDHNAEHREQQWAVVEEIFGYEQRFLRAIEFTCVGGLFVHEVTPVLGWGYEQGRLLKQFSNHERSLIIGVDEVSVPEVGSSKTLDELLHGAGFEPSEFRQLEASYGLNSVDFLDDPNKRILGPNRPKA